MKEIERYIQFAIENGSKKAKIYKEIEESGKGLLTTPLMLIFIITSKEFIEAIARGILKKFKWDKKSGVYYTGSVLSMDRTYISDCELSDEITTEQAIAIRDNKLEEFINDLLPKLKLGKK